MIPRELGRFTTDTYVFTYSAEATAEAVEALRRDGFAVGEQKRNGPGDMPAALVTIARKGQMTVRVFDMSPVATQTIWAEAPF